MFCYVTGDPVQRSLGWLFTSLATILLVFLFKREMVTNIISLQDFYKSLIYFGLLSINNTFNQLTGIKHYLKYIATLGYYYHFSERWTNLYDSTDNLPLDNTLPTSPNHAGHSFYNMFMKDLCVYNEILNRKTHPVPWKAKDLALLDVTDRQQTSIYTFVISAIWKPPKLCHVTV